MINIEKELKKDNIIANDYLLNEIKHDLISKKNKTEKVVNIMLNELNLIIKYLYYKELNYELL
jgi:hypothetical protein